jgi:uncharacterized membrane protein
MWSQAPAPRVERRAMWTVVILLCAIAVAASIRRLAALSHPATAAPNAMLALDALFDSKAALTVTHVIVGLALVLAIPVQLSSRIRTRHRTLHRWLGRALMVVGISVAVSGFAMVTSPVGGALEVSAVLVYGTALIVSLVTAWRYIRQRDVVHHREWMLRSISIALGIATTRPVVGVFFATSRLTHLTPSQFFGVAFWIGFTCTALAGEWYVRHTRRHFDVGRPRAARLAAASRFE